MLHTDKKHFAELLCAIADYYGRELSNGVIGLYWQGLRHIDIDAVEKALWEHAQNPDAGQFMPKIADITRAIHGRTTDQACIAWAKVDAAVRGIGSYADVVFDDGLIHRVIAEMGGWIWLGQQREDEWPFVAKRFEAIYRGYKMRSEVPAYPSVLIGLTNAQNMREGFSTQPPMLIGNTRRAQAVQLAGSDKPLLPMQRADVITHSLKLVHANPHTETMTHHLLQEQEAA